MTALSLPLLPLMTAAAVASWRGRPGAVGVLALTGLAATLAVGVWAAAVEPAAHWRWGGELELSVSVEGFSRVMVIFVPIIAAPVMAYAAVTEEEGRTRLLAIMLAFVGAMLVLVLAADFLSLLIAWELVGATSWALIAHQWREPANVESATQAFVTTRFGDLGFYVAAGVLFAETGSFAFASLADVNGVALGAIAAGVLLAAAAKSAQVPFSPWLFSAMAGPTPVSALLHSATLVAAGAYVLIRLSPSLEPVTWFVPAVGGVGLATALAGGVVATLQTHVKRVLAGSTSAQYGLMFIAVGASSTAAAGAQLVAHALFKSLLFLAAGVAIHATSKTDIATYRLAGKLRLVAALSGLGALALAAVPPLGAAWSKEQIVSAAAHASIWFGMATLAAGSLSAFYAARFHLLVWGQPQIVSGDVNWPTPSLNRGPGPIEVVSIALLAAGTALLSIFWLPRAGELVEDATGGTLYEAAEWEFLVSVALVAAAFSLAWVCRRCGRLAAPIPSARMQSVMTDWLGIPLLAKRAIVDPALALSRLLARIDDLVIDAGVRLAARFASLLSRLASLRSEWTVDGLVQAVASMTMLGADRTRLADEEAVDGAVEEGARGIGALGAASRRVQTGLTHHYYVLAVLGLMAMVVVLVMSL